MRKYFIVCLLITLFIFPAYGAYNTHNTVEEVTIHIGGMVDYTDVEQVYNTISSIKGVVYVELELSPPDAIVQYNYMDVHLSDILYAIQDIGFTATVE
ncbi:MAG: hypothetical protein ABRQ39_16115 [Candidatus Eremiobacterota bacterium]